MPRACILSWMLLLTINMKPALIWADVGANSHIANHSQPNILVLLADDLGWEDVGYHNEEVTTPNINAIAQNGVELDRFYVNPSCSPTRASLLTGYFSTTHGITNPIQWQSPEGLPIHWQTMPQYLKLAGYQTHLVGKWHLGSADVSYWPQNRGFDSFYGNLNGGVGYFDHIFSGGLDWQKNNKTLREDGYTTDLIATAATEIISNHPGEAIPLFLMVSFNAIHLPIQEPTNENASNQGRETLLRMISALDQAVGQIIETTLDQEWGNNTLVFFASDNGGSSPKPWLIELLIPPMRDGFSNNGSLKQGKGSVYEGGIRVPAAIWWPGKIESERPFLSPIHIADILPTFVDIAGLNVPNVDGLSLKNAFLKNRPLDARPLVVSNFGSEAMIEWPWKIIREASLPIMPSFLRYDSWYLHNIKNDPSEREDLKEEFPELFRDMRATLLNLPRSPIVEFDTDLPWETFGGKETREPWAESAFKNSNK